MQVLRVNKIYGELYRNEIRFMGVLKKTCLFEEDGDYIFIPLSRTLTADEMEKLDLAVWDAYASINPIKHREKIELPSCSPVEREGLKRSKKKTTPQNRVIARLREFGFPEHMLYAVPRKWERFGEILIIRLNEVPREYESLMANAFMEVLGATAVFADHDGIRGEFRTPELRRIAGKKSVTTHLENGIRYTFDVTGIMFSSGNIDERVHFSKIDASDETVVDMFSGIGYFTLPLAVYGRPRKIHAIEKNPQSFSYLKLNLEKNRVTNVVDPILGDNREVGPTSVADRVIMGYLPTANIFIPRALEFLRPSGGIIHFHYTCKKKERETIVNKAFRDVLHENGRVYEIMDLRVIKSYAPFIYHCVADVRVG